MSDQPTRSATTSTIPPAKDFKSMGLSSAMLKTLAAIKYEKPSPIQASFIPLAMTGRDATGQARTGTGKTAAFTIPIVEAIDFEDVVPQALVLTPTRELSEQVAVEVRKLAGNHTVYVVCCVGGKDLHKQMTELRKGVHVVVGTPGRVIDLINRGSLKLDDLEVVVLDEADRMLDIGFRPDIEKILRRCPSDRQTLLLSATMPDAVERLAKRYMRDPLRVDLSGDTIGTTNVKQYCVTVDHDRKFELLVRLLAHERPKQALVFTRTKRGADNVHRKLSSKLPGAAVIHGDLSQSIRDRVMKAFREGRIRLLVATDVMGRGIDVSGISHIINYDVPEYCDDYIHRIGRTGRLSTDVAGRAFTFVSRDEGAQLTSIEKRIGTLLESFSIPGFRAFRTKEEQALMPPAPTRDRARGFAGGRRR